MSARQTFIGRILAVTSESVIMSTVDPSRSDAIALRAGAVVRADAERLRGHVVRYTAEVSSETKCLSNPKFCIGSEYGLRAVFERREAPRCTSINHNSGDRYSGCEECPPSERVAYPKDTDGRVAQPALVDIGNGWTRTLDGSKVYDEKGHSFTCECRECG